MQWIKDRSLPYISSYNQEKPNDISEVRGDTGGNDSVSEDEDINEAERAEVREYNISI
jgi:hypothetical protein